MITDVTIKAKDFKTVHNALCGLDSVYSRVKGVLNPELARRLDRSIADIRQGLTDAYAQEDQVFNSRSQHYDEVARSLDIRFSEWSLFDVADLSSLHRWPEAQTLRYQPWEGPAVVSPITGFTWAALWMAADKVIRDSGDEHHRFVEGFRAREEDPTTLILSTGS